MIHIEHLSVHLRRFTLQDICLSLQKGEFFALLGPTGAGKTLILESIVGLVKPSNGRIRIGDRDITSLPPEKRGVSIVYQDHALFPHLNVRENISYGLRYHHNSNSSGAPFPKALIERLGLSHLLDRAVTNLSGGERQRVALARALAINPAVLLLDEPLSSLDPNFRGEIRQLLKDLHQETAITVLMVTHDFTEAHFLAQRVAILHEGSIEQVGEVSSVFLQPETPFVADFVGMKNIFSARFNGKQALVENLSFEINGQNRESSSIGIRPEHIHLFANRPGPECANLMEGIIARIGNQGVYADIAVDVAGVRFQSILTTSDLHAMGLQPGDRAFISVAPESVHLI